MFGLERQQEEQQQQRSGRAGVLKLVPRRENLPVRLCVCLLARYGRQRVAGAATAVVVVDDEVEVRGGERGRWRRTNCSVLSSVCKRGRRCNGSGEQVLLGVRLAGGHQQPHVCLRQLHTERCSGRLPALPDDERVS